MSTIAVVTSSPPFVEGGHLVIARSLVDALRDAGHRADLVITPQNRFGRQAAAYAATWLTDVGRGPDDVPVDRVISLRYPSYAVRHPQHVCWLNHTMREYYDQWEPFRHSLSWKNRVKEGVRRRLVHAADRYLLGHNVRKLFVQSRTIQQRLERWGIASDVLYPPPPQRPYRSDASEPWLFAVSRLTALKRMSLALEALAEPAARHVRVVVAGDGEEREALLATSERLGLGSRVAFVGRLDEAALVDHLARCRAVVFVPREEDYGFVTVEAFASGKPVITARDSGGPAELVRDGENGLVVDPSPPALAAAMARLAEDRAASERMGEAGRRFTNSLTWPATVERLLLPF